ncbi:hypothetical protein ADUPG1_008870, partial [Aduncisulcus paluster]
DRTLIDVACADTSKELSKKKVKKVGDFLKRAEERKFSKYENRKKIQITANFAAAARGVQESLTAFHQEIKVIIGSDVNGLKPFAVTTIGSFGQQARALLSSMRRNESSGEMDMRDSSGASMFKTNRFSHFLARAGKAIGVGLASSYLAYLGYAEKHKLSLGALW